MSKTYCALSLGILIKTCFLFFIKTLIMLHLYIHFYINFILLKCFQLFFVTKQKPGLITLSSMRRKQNLGDLNF